MMPENEGSCGGIVKTSGSARVRNDRYGVIHVILWALGWSAPPPTISRITKLSAARIEISPEVPRWQTFTHARGYH